MSLLLAGLLGRLGDLAGGGFLLGDGLDDADGHGLTHVTDGEATERRIFGESLHAHGLGGRHFHDGGITVLHGFGESFQLLARATIASEKWDRKGIHSEQNKLSRDSGVSNGVKLKRSEQGPYFFKISWNLQAM